MIRLRKVGLTALSFLALVGCSAGESSASVKGYLTSHGFAEDNITIMTGDAYKKTQREGFVADGLTEYLAGFKSPATGEELGEGFVCWFFQGIDQADKFVKDYAGDIYASVERRVKDPRMGSRNNVAWVGTSTIAVGLGWTSIA